MSTKEFRNRVRELRHEQTLGEAALWEYLRDRRLDGWKFRRQRPIERYVADFCCDAARLIIELDGGVHMTPEQRAHDEIREHSLFENGYSVLRFPTEQAVSNPEALATTIRKTLQDISPDLPLSPCGRGGRGVRGTT